MYVLFIFYLFFIYLKLSEHVCTPLTPWVQVCLH